MRILAILFYIQSMMITGCHSGQNIESTGDHLPEVNFNGEKTSLNEIHTQKLIKEINSLFSNCDDFYELIVTDNLVEKLKKEEQYLEIIFPQKQVWKAERFGDQEIQQVLIPLSGSFATADQVTFFYGISDYANTPLSVSQGSSKLIAIIQELTP
jgi:hypothetical protein